MAIYFATLAQSGHLKIIGQGLPRMLSPGNVFVKQSKESFAEFLSKL